MRTFGELTYPEKLGPLHETQPETLMGKLLRRFWHPVALLERLPRDKPMRLKVLSEELALYRGASGRLVLISNRCPHRRTFLHTGWIEGDDIRCMYHGWKFAADGSCVERPAEKAESNAQCSIRSYPVREYGGLAFAYMGEGRPPAFELPRKAPFERDDALLFARAEQWPCNWLQQVENSLDAVHVSFAHQWGSVGTFGEAVTNSIPALEYEETEGGIRQTATRPGNRIRVSNWTFPNNNHIVQPGVSMDDPWMDIGIWMTPNDDHTTTRFIIYSIPSEGEAIDDKRRAYFNKYKDYNPADHHEDLIDRRILPEDPVVELTSAQDYVAAAGQGSIADRQRECLGASDKGVVFLRRMLWREMEKIDSGTLTKEWRSVSDVMLPKQLPHSNSHAAGA